MLSCRWGLPTTGRLATRRTTECTNALLSRGVVGATGFEPVTSSVSEGSGAFEEQRDASSCFTAPQMVGPIGYGAVVYREAA